MKKSCVSLSLLIAAVFLFTSLSPAQKLLRKKRPATPQKMVLPHRVVFEKAPKLNLATINKARLSEHMGVALPAPLPATKRAGLINKFRRAAGMSAANINLTEPSPPVQVVLTPAAPMKDRCDFSVWIGSHYPSGKGAVITKACPYAVGHGHKNGRFFLNFWTQPGKSYFLDISVSPAGTWNFSGGINGTLLPVDGHLTAGFRANNTTTEIQFYRPAGGGESNFYFYRAELTQID